MKINISVSLFFSSRLQWSIRVTVVENFGKNFASRYLVFCLCLIDNYLFVCLLFVNRFALQGNAFDLAIGIILGSAFTAVVQSLVNDILTPPFGLLFGGVDFSNLTIKMNNFVHKDQPPVVIRYGAFIQTVIYLLIVALVLFFIIKSMNKMHKLAVKRKREEQEQDQQSQQGTELKEANEELAVLKEIRDLLARK